MSINENGIMVDSFTVQNLHQRVPEGTVVGITLGWFFGALGLYALGIFIIWKLNKKRGGDQESKVSNQSADQAGTQQIGASKGKHRKQTFDENPTLEMVNVTDMNEVDSHEIKLGFTKNRNQMTAMQRQENQGDDKQE